MGRSVGEIGLHSDATPETGGEGVACAGAPSIGTRSLSPLALARTLAESAGILGVRGIAFAGLAALLLFAGAAIPFVPGLLREAGGAAIHGSSLGRIAEKRRALEDKLTSLRREQDGLKRGIYTNDARMERRILADIDRFEEILARTKSGEADPAGKLHSLETGLDPTKLSGAAD